MNFDLIIFDLGNVIFLYDHTIISDKISRLEGIPKQEIHRVLFHAGFYEGFDKGKVSPEDFFRQVRDRLGLKMDFETFVPIWSDIFFENKPITSLIGKLQNKYKIYVLSNTNQLHFNHLMRKFPIMNKIEKFILSFAVGSSKPHPAIYRAALDEANVNPSRVIFIDDYSEFTEGAKRLNIHGIQFKDETQLLNELVSLGIDCN